MAYRECIQAFKAAIPPLTNALHKGSNGRIGVIGGSLEYTGAPYFAAISALKAGADLVHVFCHSAAAPVIKAYSPELIVHPILDADDGKEQILEWSKRLHALVVGPGLGRNPGTLDRVLDVLKELNDIPVVLDADGLFLLTNYWDGWRDFLKTRHYIITPNLVEMERVRQRFPMGLHAIYLIKGENDSIILINGRDEIICNAQGSPRRCGGQGDVLSGIAGIFAAWALTTNDPNMLGNAAVAASALTRRCSNLAFRKYKRSMVAGNLIEFLGPAFDDLFNDII